jgi:periplasmic protein TonB
MARFRYDGAKLLNFETKARTISAAVDHETGALPAEAGFRANPSERPYWARASLPLSRPARWGALAGAFLLHAIILSLLILDYHWEAPLAAPQEIPVEFIVEKPQPQAPEPPAPSPSPAPSPQPETQTNPLNLEPAHDAPRAANDEKEERDASDKATKAPRQDQPTKDPGQDSADKPAAAPTPQNEPVTAEKPTEPTPDKAADASSGAVPANSQSPDAVAAQAQAQPEKLASLIGQPLPNWSNGGRFSTFDSVPDVQLGSAAEQTVISGGKAKKTYLTVLYGKIMAHVRNASLDPDGATKHSGEVVFIVDGSGGLVQRQISRSSGSRQLDDVALAAVAAAAPFPAPPQGLPVKLRFTYGEN